MDNRQLATQELAKRELARRELKRRQSVVTPMQPVEPSRQGEDFFNRTSESAFPDTQFKYAYQSGKPTPPEQKPLANMRFGAPEMVADVTSTVNPLPSINRQQDRTIPSGQPEIRTRDFQPSIQEPPVDRAQNLKDFAGGTAIGVLPFEVEPKPYGSIVSRLAYNLQNRPAADVGKFVGALAPITGAYGASEKLLSKAIAPLSRVAQAAVRGSGAGAILEGVKQAGKGEFDPEAIGESAAMFGGFDVAGLGLGAGVRALRGKKAEAPLSVEPQGKTVSLPEMKPEGVTQLAPAQKLNAMREQGVPLEQAKKEITGEAAAARNDRAQSMVAGSVGGSALGFERDDDGNITYDPLKGLAGTALGIAALRGVKGGKTKAALDPDIAVGKIDKLFKSDKPIDFWHKDFGARQGFDVGLSKTKRFLKGDLSSEQYLLELKNSIPKKYLENGEVPKRYIEALADESRLRDVGYDVLQSMPKMGQPTNTISEIFGKSLENPIRTFDKLGKKAKSFFYDSVVSGDHEVAVKHDIISKALDNTIKEAGISKFGVGKAMKNVYTYAVSLQPNGLETLKKMGVEVPALTPGEQKVYGFMRNSFDTFFREVNKARIAVGEKPFKPVKDYFTFFRNLEEVMEQGGWNHINLPANKVDDAIKISIPASSVDDVFVPSGKTAFGFAKQRLKSTVPFDLDAAKAFNRYTRSALRYIELAPKLQNFKNIVAGRSVDGFSLAEKNPAAYQFITKWTHHLAGVKEPTDYPWVRTTLNKLNRNVAFATLSANFNSAAIQPTAYLNSWVELGSRRALSGAYRNMTEEGRKFALKESKVLLNRENEVGLHTGLSLTNLKGTVAEKGLFFLKYLDMETARATWLGSYDKAIKDLKLSPKEAVTYADDIVTKTQGSAAPRDLTPLQRTELGKTLTLFQTFAINNYGFLKNDLLGKDLSKAEKAGRVLRLLAGTQIVNSIYSDVLKLNSPVPNPIGAYRDAMKKEPDNPAGALGGAALELGGVIPLVGGGLRYGSSPFGATSQLAIDAIKQGNQAAQGKPNIKALSKLTMQAAGVPGTNQLFKLINAQNEKVKPKSKSKKQSSPFGGFGQMKGFD